MTNKVYVVVKQLTFESSQQNVDVNPVGVFATEALSDDGTYKECKGDDV